MSIVVVFHVNKLLPRNWQVQNGQQQMTTEKLQHENNNCWYEQATCWEWLQHPVTNIYLSNMQNGWQNYKITHILCAIQNYNITHILYTIQNYVITHMLWKIYNGRQNYKATHMLCTTHNSKQIKIFNKKFKMADKIKCKQSQFMAWIIIEKKNQNK